MDKRLIHANRCEHIPTKPASKMSLSRRSLPCVRLSFFFAINRLLKLTNLAKSLRLAFYHKAKKASCEAINSHEFTFINTFTCPQCSYSKEVAQGL